MKHLQGLLFITLMILLNSCSPKVSTSLSADYPPLDYTQKVVVIELDEPIPDNSEKIGQVKIGDSGFSTKCSYKVVLDEAKLEARRVGGNAIKITRHKTPDLWSTCHRITAVILKVDNTKSL